MSVQCRYIIPETRKRCGNLTNVGLYCWQHPNGEPSQKGRRTVKKAAKKKAAKKKVAKKKARRKAAKRARRR